MKTARIFLLFLVFVAGCGGSRWVRGFEINETAFDSEVMRIIREDTGLHLPSSAKGIHFRYSPPVDPSFVAKMEIPKESRQQILIQIQAIQNEEMNMIGALNEKVNWWLSADESVVIDRQCSQHDGDYFRAIVTERSNQTFLYVSHAVF